MAAPPVLAAVVAVARNGVIGQRGGMPWTLRSDLARFRRLTLGKPMIMGRRTLDAIGRVLDGRDTVVLTRGERSVIEGVHPAAGADEAVEIARRLAGVRGVDEIAVIGGAEVYRLLWPRLGRLHVTHVEAEPEGDTLFPAIDPKLWRLVRLDAPLREPGDSAATRYALYEPRSPG